MEFRKYLAESTKEIEQELEIYLQSWLKQIKTESPNLETVHQIFVDSCQGGKRLRGFLVKLGFEIAQDYRGAKLIHLRGGQDIFKVAAAMEIFQTAILIHDDIIDQSPTRRGKPTVYHQLGGNHHGISQAISLGDIGFFLAVKLIQETNFPAELKNKALGEFSKMAIKTGLGEMLDVAANSFEEKDILTIYKLKTAYYAVCYPLIMGATLGKATPKLTKYLEEYGLNLGIAYQIKDDILGVFGDEKSLGKSVKSDIEEGKKTLLIAYALKNTSKVQKEFLKKVYGKKEITQPELESVKKIFKESGALEYANSRAKFYTDEAKKSLKQINVKKETLIILSEMADFLIQRQK